jgi:hypothetical protein
MPFALPPFILGLSKDPPVHHGGFDRLSLNGVCEANSIGPGPGHGKVGQLA